jgi:hypothetical protein
MHRKREGIAMGNQIQGERNKIKYRFTIMIF